MVHPLLVAAALATACCTPASAITLQGAQVQGGSTVADFSGASLLSFDIEFANFAPVVLDYRVDAGDTAVPIALEAMLRNFSGSGLAGYSFTLDRGSFATVGSVTRQFSGSATVGVNGGLAVISFDTPEFLDVEIGDVLGTTPGASDWTLAGLAEGERFTLTVSAIPEPATYALMLFGLAALSQWARRRRG